MKQSIIFFIIFIFLIKTLPAQEEIDLNKNSKQDKVLNQLGKVIDRIIKENTFTFNDSKIIRHIIQKFLGNGNIRRKSEEKRSIVKKLIGETAYENLESIAINELDSEDELVVDTAIGNLGKALYSKKAVDLIKMNIFHANEKRQLIAIMSLAYLDVPGCHHLLHNVILSGKLADISKADVLKTLWESNDPKAIDIALSLINSDFPLAIQVALDVLKKHPDYYEIISELFVSEDFTIPDKPTNEIENLIHFNLENKFLREIMLNPQHFMNNAGVKKKLIKYATYQKAMFVKSLVSLEKLGEDISYFENLATLGNNSNKKRQMLNVIITRLRKEM